MTSCSGSELPLELLGASLRYTPGGPTSLKSLALAALRGRPAPPRPGALWALRDVTLRCRDGDRIGLLGDNGAGKTSLLQLMCGIYPPTEGRVRRRGFVVPLLQLGLGFNPELSGRENVLLAAAMLRIPRDRIAHRVDAIFEFCELRDAADVAVKYYSAGMAARLAFGVATEVEPEILLLDEIFAVGDIHWTARATLRMERLLEKLRVLVFASHEMSLLARFCSRGVWLDGGRLVADGPIDEVLERYTAGAASD